MLAERSQTIEEVLHRYWGYDELRPLQRDAIEAAVARRDSLTVMPTGGGKSLCYQIPPIVADRTDIVVSPLISLMKDQVDGLKACGYPAAAIHSGLSEEERRDVNRRILAGEYRLLFVSPERLQTPWFLAICQRLKVGAFAIDEAHCISQWGHDFRPEYRQLASLKQHFPQASLHAYTATATPRVQQDIIEQLGLKQPAVLVGSADRPNLTYRVLPRTSVPNQVMEALQRHKDEAVIIYCISRNDVEELAANLRDKGIKAAAYHAGLSAEVRARTQEQFAAERTDVVVATVAFGMGIDRSNVRCVIHAAMPKSVEHYQQETGRAGRDGLPAECILLHSNADVRRWKFVMTKASEEGKQTAASLESQFKLLDEMERYCSSQSCRHAALSEYFGQTYASAASPSPSGAESSGCGACDVCEGGEISLEDASDFGRKVLACIKNLRTPFGVGYVVDVLLGSGAARIRQNGHNSLPEYGALRSWSRAALQDRILQMVSQGLLSRTSDDRPVLELTQASKEVMSGKSEVKLRAIKRSPGTFTPSIEEADAGLFQALRTLRRTVAEERGVPPFVIFSDATLRDLCIARPSNLGAMQQVRGVGEQKLAELGDRFVSAIKSYCTEHNLRLDVGSRPLEVQPRIRSTGASSPSKSQAFSLFEQAASLEAVSLATGRSSSTVASYLEDYVAERKPASVEPWVDAETYTRVESAARKIEGSFLRPVFEALNGDIPYEDIRIVMRHAGLR